jgi:hypothetical protein
MADGGDQWCGPAQAAVIGGLAAHIREQVPESGVDRAQPAALGAIPQQDLGHRQTDQLGVADSGRPARPVPRFQQLVNGDVQCDDEVVETGVHGPPWRSTLR